MSLDFENDYLRHISKCLVWDVLIQLSALFITDAVVICESRSGLAIRGDSAIRPDSRHHRLWFLPFAVAVLGGSWDLQARRPVLRLDLVESEVFVLLREVTSRNYKQHTMSPTNNKDINKAK